MRIGLVVPGFSADAADWCIPALRHLARSLAANGDMIAFWPNAQEYTHLIVCIEQGRGGVTPGGNGGLNAGVQRVNVVTGQVETLLHGTSGCDGIRSTRAPAMRRLPFDGRSLMLRLRPSCKRRRSSKMNRSTSP